MEEPVNLDRAWMLITKLFPILNDVHGNTFAVKTASSGDDDLAETMNVLKSLSLCETIENLIIARTQDYLRKSIVPAFWAHFKNTDSNNGFKRFYSAIKLLHDRYSDLREMYVKLEILRNTNDGKIFIYGEKNVLNTLKLIVRSTILAQIDINYQECVQTFYEDALQSEDLDPAEFDNQCGICYQDLPKCNCDQLFIETNKKLVEMGLLEPLTSHVLTTLTYNYISSHIQKICKDSFDTSYVAALEEWLNVVVLRWLQKIYCGDSSNSPSGFASSFVKKLNIYLYSTYTKMRIEQLFNIIIEYPESLPALEDIRVCLPKTDLRGYLTRKLQSAMETRLLHPGVSTSDVLTAYVATIKSLRVFDPTGSLLEIITQPIHHYLRSRSDTVRCVVSSLTEEGANDLAEELIRGDAVQIDEKNPPEEEDENWETWVPDPVDTHPSKTSVYRRTSDIISMLVNVYGSKELFVNEYRTLLADRLLSHYTCDTEKEIRYLELLKLRFGESHLHLCEVMLKDMGDSKRINSHIRQDPNFELGGIPLTALIVSAQFWPAFKDEKLELHQTLVNQMNNYTKCFEILKGSRTLSWKKHLGVVDLEIEMPDRVLNLSVSPAHATVIMHFQDKNRWVLDELSKTMNIPGIALRRKINFWKKHGLIIEPEPNIYVLDESQIPIDRHQEEDIIIEDYERESAMASAQDQREEELQTFWSYIIGMLTNLDSLSLERIHQMLKMFAFQGAAVEYSLKELKAFLDKKVKQHQLIHTNGLYKLPKNS